MRALARIARLALAAAVAVAAQCALGQIALDGASSATTGAGGSLTINRPAGVNAGDVLIAQFASRGGSDRTITSPAGWVLIERIDSGTNLVQALYFKVATAAEPASYAFAFGGNGGNSAAGGILAYSGVDATTPVHKFAGQANASSTTVTATPAAAGNYTTPFTTFLGNSHLVGFFATRTGTTFAPVGMTERYDVTPGSNVTAAAADVAFTTPANVGQRTATAGAGAENIGQLIALRPAGAAQTLLAHYRMDEAAWTGGANEVLDASGRGLHGSRVGTPTTAPAIKCRGGTFAGPSNSQYVNVGGLAQQGRLDIQDQFTVTAWLRPNAWPGAGLMSFLSKDTNYEAHITSTGQINWWWQNDAYGGAGTLDNFTGAGVVPINQWTFVALVYSYGQQRIWVGNATTGVAVQFTGNDTNGLLLNALPLQIAQDQAFGGRDWNGMIDDVRIYNNALTQAQLDAIRLSGGCVDHYAISYPNGATGITCEASDVLITAHDAAHNPLAPPAGTSLALTTASATGVWQAGLVAGTGTWTPSNLNNGQATYVWPGTESSFRVRLRSAAATTLNVNLTDGTAAEAATEDPNLVFANSLFRFVDNPAATPPYAGNPINPQISGKPSNTGFGAQPNLVLQAIRTDSSGACTGIYNGAVSVQLAFECVNPATCQAGQQVAFTNNAATTNLPQNAAGAVGATSGNWQAVNVLFGADSRATFGFAYPDAGEIRLHARSVFTPPAGGLTSTYGASGTIVVRPFGFRIGVAGPGTGLGGAASAPTVVAGTNFNTTLTAVRWKSGDDANADGIPDSQAQIAANAATPNFGLESTPATATLASTLTEPVGGAAGALANSSFTGFASGARTQAVSFSEVGIVTLTAATANYLGGGQSVTAGPGLAGVGRFIPARFVLSGGTLTNRAASSCAPASAFTYLGEGLQLQFTLTAQNAAGATTTNYRGSFAKLPLTAAGLNFGARDLGGAGTNLTSRISVASITGAWGNGVATNVQATLAVNRASPDNPDGPFNQTKLGIAPLDAPDGVALAAAALDFDVDGAGGNDRAQVGTDTQLRFGRLRLLNAIGSERLALPVPLRLEYWTGSAFATNTLDSCTTLAPSTVTLSNYQLNLAACETALGASPITFANGTATATLAAPGAGNNGAVDLRVNLGAAAGQYCTTTGGAGNQSAATSAARSSLRGRWNATNDDGDATTAYDDDPTGRAAFGLYGTDKTPNQFIYFRENH